PILIKITGETGFNEVIFENLEVDDKYRLDEVGNGWQVAMTTLLHERGAGPLVTPASGGKGRSEDDDSNNAGAYGLIELAKKSFRNGKSSADDAVLRDEIMKLVIRQEGMRQNGRRARVPALLDHP